MNTSERKFVGQGIIAHKLFIWQLMQSEVKFPLCEAQLI